jgi:hypothetical protein
LCCPAAGVRRPTDHLDDERIRYALTVRERRRVRRDNTLEVAGLSFQLDQGFLAGRVITVAYCMLDDPPAPVVEFGDKRFELHPVDPIANATTPRPPRRADESGTAARLTGFNPPTTLLRLATGRPTDGERQP